MARHRKRPVGRQPTQEIVLSIGRGELVKVPGSMADVFVANEEVADVQIKSQRQLYVFGKAGGETTVYASNAAATHLSANIRVGSNIGSVDQMLNMAMPEAKIRVSTMGTNTVLLTGTVAAPEDAAEAERLVQAFVGEGSNVISRLKMATPLQVNLQVRFAEVSRSLVRDIGANLLPSTVPVASNSASAGRSAFTVHTFRRSVQAQGSAYPLAHWQSHHALTGEASVSANSRRARRLRALDGFLGLDCWVRSTCPNRRSGQHADRNRT